MRARGSHVTVAASAWVSRGLSAAASLVSIRLLLADLGEARYAAHVLLGSLLAWFLVSDLGLRNATQSEVSRRIGTGRTYSDVVFGGLLGILVLSPIWGVLLLIFRAPLAEVYLGGLGLPSEEMETALVVTAVLGLLTSVGNLAYNVWYAEGRGYRANGAAVASALGSLALVGWVSKSGVEARLEAQLLAVLGFPAVVALVSLSLVLNSNRGASVGKIRAALHGLYIPAQGFLGISLLSTFLLYVDVWVLSETHSSDAVVTFALVSRPFEFFRLGYNALLQAVRPEWTVAAVSGDRKWFATLLARYHRSGVLLAVVFTGVLAVCSRAVFELLAPPSEGTGLPAGLASGGSTLVLAFGMFEVLRTHANAHFMALLAIGRLRSLIVLLAVQGGLVLGLEWLWVAEMGVLAIPLGGAAAYAALSAWLAPVSVRAALLDIGRCSAEATRDARRVYAHASSVTRTEAESARRS